MSMDFTRYAGEKSRLLPAYRIGIPLLAGGIMLLASFLPWLLDPLRPSLSAWQLSLDFGWQVRLAALNYGLLCTVCALYTWHIAYRAWQARYQDMHTAAVTYAGLARACTIAAWLCGMTLVLFIWQFLFADMQVMSQLSRHEIQYLLTSQSFDYGVSAQLAPVTNPLRFDPAELQARAMLLVDLSGPGALLPLGSVILLLSGRRFFPTLLSPLLGRGWSQRALLFGVLFFAIVLGRAPLALAAQNQAEQALSTGLYADALRWIDTAYVLNPELDQFARLHRERGQAWFFLHPEKTTVDTYVYLASTYRGQQDYLNSYQALMLAWHMANRPAWLTDEIYMTCVQLATISKPLMGPSFQRLDNEEPSLPWIEALLQTDPTNVYGLYVAGRIEYDLHNYSQCAIYMRRLSIATPNMLVRSSAYTYMALSSAGQGDYLHARALLFQAIALDPTYRNNTAREELSGLR